MQRAVSYRPRQWSTERADKINEISSQAGQILVPIDLASFSGIGIRKVPSLKAASSDRGKMYWLQD